MELIRDEEDHKLRGNQRQPQCHPLQGVLLRQGGVPPLHISERTIRELAHREEDPLPFRILFGQQINCFIHRENLMDWLESNSQLIRDAAKKQTGQA